MKLSTQIHALKQSYIVDPVIESLIDLTAELATILEGEDSWPLMEAYAARTFARVTAHKGGQRISYVADERVSGVKDRRKLVPTSRHHVTGLWWNYDASEWQTEQRTGVADRRSKPMYTRHAINATVFEERKGAKDRRKGWDALDEHGYIPACVRDGRYVHGTRDTYNRDRRKPKPEAQYTQGFVDRLREQRDTYKTQRDALTQSIVGGTDQSYERELRLAVADYATREHKLVSILYHRAKHEDVVIKGLLAEIERLACMFRYAMQEYK